MSIPAKMSLAQLSFWPKLDPAVWSAAQLHFGPNVHRPKCQWPKCHSGPNVHGPKSRIVDIRNDFVDPTYEIDNPSCVTSEKARNSSRCTSLLLLLLELRSLLRVSWHASLFHLSRVSQLYAHAPSCVDSFSRINSPCNWRNDIIQPNKPLISPDHSDS